VNLEYDELDGEWCHHGMPFTGQTYVGPPERPTAVTEYRDGQFHGYCWSWHPDGSLERAVQYFEGVYHGCPRSGTRRAARALGGMEMGIAIYRRRWSATGTLIDHSPLPMRAPTAIPSGSGGSTSSGATRPARVVTPNPPLHRTRHLTRSARIKA